MSFFNVYRLGEVCSHVAPLPFKIEAACRLGYTKPSSTSLPCQWNRDFKTGVCIQVTLIYKYYIKCVC